MANHRSGDFAIGFANDRSEQVAESDLDALFRGVTEGTEDVPADAVDSIVATTLERTIRGGYLRITFG